MQLYFPSSEIFFFLVKGTKILLHKLQSISILSLNEHRKQMISIGVSILSLNEHRKQMISIGGSILSLNEHRKQMISIGEHDMNILASVRS